MYVTLLAIFLIVYGLTLQRGVAWQDSGLFQWRIVQADPTGRMGLALSHPLLIVLGRLASLVPVGPVPWRINMVSAVAGAFAVANVGLLIRRLAPQRPSAAWLGAAFLGLAHSTWWLATICESQTLHLALFTFALLVLVSLVQHPRQRSVLLLGLLSGLALTAHNLALLAVPAYVAIVAHLCRQKRLPFRCLLLLAVGYLVGASAFLALTVMAATKVGLAQALRSALFGDHWQNAVLLGSLKSVKFGLAYVAYNLPNLALPLAVVGLLRMRNRLPSPLFWAWLYLLGIYLWFAIRYDVTDVFMFYLPFYALVAAAAGLGMAWLAQPGRAWLAAAAWVSLLWTPVCYAAALVLCHAGNVNVPGRKDLPYRDAARYWLAPWKGSEQSAERFARAALTQASAGSTVIADGTAYYPLVLTQWLDRMGPEVALVNAGEAADRSFFGKDNVFVVSSLEAYIPKEILKKASLRRKGVLYEVLWRAPGGHGQQPAGALTSAPAADSMVPRPFRD